MAKTTRHNELLRGRAIKVTEEEGKSKINYDKRPTDRVMMIDWAKAVKAKAGNKCEYCGKTDRLNSHHIFSRSKKSTRYDIDNGVSLCVAHHTFSSGFSAHKTPTEFVEWIKETRGEEWYTRLRENARKIMPSYVPTEQLVDTRRELRNIIDEHENNNRE